MSLKTRGIEDFLEHWGSHMFLNFVLPFSMPVFSPLQVVSILSPSKDIFLSCLAGHAKQMAI